MAQVIDLETEREKKRKRYAEAHKAWQKHLASQVAPEPSANFFRISHATISHPDFAKLSANAKTLFLYLCACRNRFQHSKAYFSVPLRFLAKMSGMKKTTIARARDELTEARFILWTSKGKNRTKYQIIDLKK